jgi:putative membrane protein
VVTYNPKEWFRPLYQFHKSDTFRKLLPLVLFVGVYATGVAWFELRFLKLSNNSQLKSIPAIHSLLGVVISLLLVFRTNTAYDRWWEGRKLWGALVNCSRNLAVKLDAILLPDDKYNRDFFERLLSIFPKELRLHLQMEKTRLELDSRPHPEIPDFDRSMHVPSQIISLLEKRIIKLYRDKKIQNEELLILNTELVAFLDICGACERIKNTPIPWSYSSFLKKFIFIYVLTMPIGFVFTMGYYMVPAVMLVFYVLASLEVIAEEIEDPFGIDANDLPMEKLTQTIAKNVDEILGRS